MYVSDDGTPSAFRSQGIPATFILDREGRIVFRHLGSALWDDESSVRFLNELLAKEGHRRRHHMSEKRQGPRVLVTDLRLADARPGKGDPGSDRSLSGGGLDR